jgi:hypothetical protein
MTRLGVTSRPVDLIDRNRLWDFTVSSWSAPFLEPGLAVQHERVRVELSCIDGDTKRQYKSLRGQDKISSNFSALRIDGRYPLDRTKFRFRCNVILTEPKKILIDHCQNRGALWG